jgi:hypothetical protein
MKKPVSSQSEELTRRATGWRPEQQADPRSSRMTFHHATPDNISFVAGPVKVM